MQKATTFGGIKDRVSSPHLHCELYDPTKVPFFLIPIVIEVVTPIKNPETTEANIRSTKFIKQTQPRQTTKLSQSRLNSLSYKQIRYYVSPKTCRP